MQPSLWQAMPDRDYFAHPALGSTDLKQILVSVKHWEHEKNNPSEPSESMRFGTLLHRILAFPDDRLLLVQQPVADLRTKAGKEVVAKFKEESAAEGLLVVTESDYRDLNGIFESVMSHRVCKAILSKGVPETAAFATDERGVQRKVKPDWRREEGLIFDFKSTRIFGAKPSNWRNTCFQYWYLLQAAYYLDTANLVEPGRYDKFIWIAIEKDAPYAVCVHQIDDFYLELGRAQYTKALDMFLNFKQTGKAVAYEEIIHLMSQENPDYRRD